MTRHQRYVSEDLAHFVGRSLRPEEHAQYDLLVKILKSGVLLNEVGGSPQGAAAGVNFARPLFPERDGGYRMSMVCFCDIPEQDLVIHQKKYGRFGLSFAKTFLIRFGARPVFYVPENASMGVHAVPTVREAFNREVAAIDAVRRIAMGRMEPRESDGANVFTDHLAEAAFDVIGWVEGQLLQYIKGFDAIATDEDEENVYMEREWRTWYSVRFSLEDISRVFIPREFRAHFRKDLPEYTNQLSFVSELD